MHSPLLRVVLAVVAVFVGGGLAFAVLYFGIRAMGRATDLSVLLARRHELLAKAERERLEAAEVQEVLDLTRQMQANLSLAGRRGAVDGELRTAEHALRTFSSGDWEGTRALLSELGRRMIKA